MGAVTFGDDIRAALPDMRMHAESLMFDTGEALRPFGEPTYNPATQQDEYERISLFTSKCKIQARSLAPGEHQVGERTAVTIRLELHLPTDTPPLTTGDEWRMRTVDGLSTVPVDRVYRVVAPVEKSLTTSRRYSIEEVVA